MAKFEDYQNREDELGNEIDNAAAQSQDRQDNVDNIPERFKGKSAEEIAQSYVELEQLNSRQGQELGDLRRTVDQIVTNTVSQQTSQSPEVDDQPVTMDDLYDDVSGTIARVANEGVNARIEELESKLIQSELNVGINSLSGEYEGWQEEVKSPEFQNFLAEKNYRQSLYAKANKYDFEAASELLEMYYDLKGKRQDNETANREQQQRDTLLQQATLETGGGTPVQLDDTFSREDLMEKRIAAKNGDPAADRWLRENAKAVTIAYEEGRVI